VTCSAVERGLLPATFVDANTRTLTRKEPGASLRIRCHRRRVCRLQRPLRPVGGLAGRGPGRGDDHAQLEERLHADGLGLLRQLLQDSLDLRASREQRLDQVVDGDGHQRGTAEGAHQRRLATVFGDVVVSRMAYRARGRANLHPADAALNLPAETHSHGLRRLAAVEAARGSFDDAAAAVGRATGVRLGKRQVEQLAARAAADVDAFYAAHAPQPAADAEVLVLSFDGKGVVMRPEGCARPPPRPPPAASCRAGCPRARSDTASGWPRSPPCTT
jgi:hypothetical protein